MTEGSDGSFYGTTNNGGSSANGTIFKVTPAGSLTTLHSFSALDGNNHNSDGSHPQAGLIQGSDGNFYGTTQTGGSGGGGTAFQVTPTGKVNLLHSFSMVVSGTNSDGAYPSGGLVQGSDGSFYGTTFYGGSGGGGTAFKITVNGPVGAVYGSSLLTTTATALDLTAEGTSDWAHIGRGRYLGFDHKSAVGYLIGNFTVEGAGTVSANSDDLRTCSWTDGDPTASLSGDKTVEQVGSIGNGFQLSAIADTTPRTLTVYVGGTDSGGKLIAHLSDGSAPDFMETRAATAGAYDVAYTLTYHAGSSGQTLYVKWTQSVGTGSVSLAGATLH